MQAVLLRRTKSSTIDGEPVVKLPPREQQLVRKAFSMSEQKFYDQVQAESMQQLKACASAAGLHVDDVHHPHLCNTVMSIVMIHRHEAADKLTVIAPLLAGLLLHSTDCCCMSKPCICIFFVL